MNLIRQESIVGKRKKSGADSSPVVWREFGANSPALQRGTPDLPPQQQSLRVQTTRKGKGGKTVTVISGFQSSPDTLTKLLKQLKAKCGTGGTVKDNTLEIQGDHRQPLMQLLTDLGYPTKISGG